ncbi:tRNA uridine 5-carboxymethylaminomethyl modification enzyme MnmG 2 [Dissostichus eleginoides]|uniref:tRNA uridine 5-carboxymethylaminomethyl modification enzyme MnmG 2 n=1 Tax=Dissostichus eleginoides TaxID=100907 RepID=A0AAD9EQJ4_DISEL|nr:tRNA uridine 5-carboxymethylaminomethyl modification enzyme MnmG 2 [Dissostichus eleginoides]
MLANHLSMPTDETPNIDGIKDVMLELLNRPEISVKKGKKQAAATRGLCSSDLQLSEAGCGCRISIRWCYM